MFARGHFRVIQQAGIQLPRKLPGIQIDSHKSNRLAAIAERLPPFFSRAFRHLGLADVLVANSPPFSGGCLVRFRTSQIKAAHKVHSRGEPEETFCAEDPREASLQ
jgi:hypothetical protein